MLQELEQKKKKPPMGVWFMCISSVKNDRGGTISFIKGGAECWYIEQGVNAFWNFSQYGSLQYELGADAARIKFMWGGSCFAKVGTMRAVAMEDVAWLDKLPHDMWPHGKQYTTPTGFWDRNPTTGGEFI